MSQSCHGLRARHGYDRLHLPDDPDLRKFFTNCMESLAFQGASSEREQVHLCAYWARMEPREVSQQQLADFFDISKSTVEYHLSRPFDILGGCEQVKTGRPGLFQPDQLRELEDFIRERFDLKIPVTYEDLREYSETKWGIVAPANTFRVIISRNAKFRTVIGEPMEDARLFADSEQIESYFTDLEETIRVGNVPASFVINVDESGFDQYVDARKTTRIVPAEYSHKSIPVGITRAEKRATLIAAIAADGSALRPMVVIQRETVEKELLLRGYTVDKVYLRRSDTGFVNTKLFLDWGREIFFPELKRRRFEQSYEGPIVLIFDGFGCHQSDAFLELAEENNVICKRIPPHTSDQLQPLDLGVFANQKRWQSNITVDADLNRQTKQIIKICDSYRMATTPKNVIGAFRKGGIVTWLDDSTLTLMVRVDPRYATRVRDDAEDADRRPEGRERVRV